MDFFSSSSAPSLFAYLVGFELLGARSRARAPWGGYTPHVTVITPTRDGKQGTLSRERDKGMREQKREQAAASRGARAALGNEVRCKLVGSQPKCHMRHATTTGLGEPAREGTLRANRAAAGRRRPSLPPRPPPAPLVHCPAARRRGGAAAHPLRCGRSTGRATRELEANRFGTVHKLRDRFLGGEGVGSMSRPYPKYMVRLG